MVVEAQLTDEGKSMEAKMVIEGLVVEADLADKNMSMESKMVDEGWLK